jgi:hypothetical protein
MAPPRLCTVRLNAAYPFVRISCDRRIEIGGFMSSRCVSNPASLIHDPSVMTVYQFRDKEM